MKTFVQFLLSEGMFSTRTTQPWHSTDTNSPQDLISIYDLAIKKAEEAKPRLEAILRRASHGQGKIIIGPLKWQREIFCGPVCKQPYNLGDNLADLWKIYQALHEHDTKLSFRVRGESVT